MAQEDNDGRARIGIMPINPSIRPGENRAYDDSELQQAVSGTLYNRGQGNFVADAVQLIENHIASLPPQQQLARAKALAEAAGGRDLNSFLASRYSGITSATDIQNIKAYQAFKDMLGRDPNSNEYAQIQPIYRQDPTLANAWLAQFAEQERGRPENLVEQAPQYRDQVNNLVNTMLGRDATPEESQHFGAQLASGNVDVYQLQDFLRGTPEYQRQEDTRFRTGLAGELQGYDTSFFNKAKEDVLSRFADTGGLQNRSSALDFALTDLMGKIAERRGEYLAGLSAGQYGSNKDLALENYRNQMNQYLGRGQDVLGRSRQQQDYYQGRSNEISDYNRQMRDYLDLAGRGRGGGGPQWGSLIGGAIGAGIGGFSGAGPAGAQAGWQIGSGLGGGYDQYRSWR